MNKQFADFITPGFLYGAAIVFGVITALIVAAIYFFLAAKKRKFFERQGMENILNEWISIAVINDEPVHIHVSPELLDYFKTQAHRQFAIELLVKSKKNLTGVAAINLKMLYEQLELQYDSVKKLKSTQWHMRVQGIFELYMMEQSLYAETISKFTNDYNEDIRNEAQIANVAFQGFDGLSFLDELSYDLLEWQQIELLERLRPLDPRPMRNLPKWIQSSNEYVVVFALKLAEIYQAYEVKEDAVSRLSDSNQKIRSQAIKTLAKIGDEQLIPTLLQRYEQESIELKLEILHALSDVGGKEQNEFYLKELNEGNNEVKLAAMFALAKTRTAEAYTIAEGKGELYQSIYAHVKQELSR